MPHHVARIFMPSTLINPPIAAVSKPLPCPGQTSPGEKDSEPRKNNSLSIESWLFSRDPYCLLLSLYKWVNTLYNPNQPGFFLHCSSDNNTTQKGREP